MCIVRKFWEMGERVVCLVGIMSRTVVTNRSSLFGEECVSVAEWVDAHRSGEGNGCQSRILCRVVVRHFEEIEPWRDSAIRVTSQ